LYSSTACAGDSSGTRRKWDCRSERADAAFTSRKSAVPCTALDFTITLRRVKPAQPERAHHASVRTHQPHLLDDAVRGEELAISSSRRWAPKDSRASGAPISASTSGCAWPRMSAPRAHYRRIRAVLVDEARTAASRKNTGVPPTARNARTGEFTPPGWLESAQRARGCGRTCRVRLESKRRRIRAAARTSGRKHRRDHRHHVGARGDRLAALACVMPPIATTGSPRPRAPRRSPRAARAPRRAGGGGEHAADGNVVRARRGRSPCALVRRSSETPITRGKTMRARWRPSSRPRCTPSASTARPARSSRSR
jgi:hypothetical protein